MLRTMREKTKIIMLILAVAFVLIVNLRREGLMGNREINWAKLFRMET